MSPALGLQECTLCMTFNLSAGAINSNINAHIASTVLMNPSPLHPIFTAERGEGAGVSVSILM